MSYDSVDHFMTQAARIPLLTHEEEIHLARSVQRMHAILEAKLEGPYTKMEQAHLRRGKRAKERFVNANLRLVANVAGKYHRAIGSSLDLHLEDLIQEGMFGLIRAVEKFDSERGYKFSTYAYWWIRQSIIRGMQSNGRAIRLPQHVHEKIYTLKQRHHSMALALGRPPTTQDMADELKISREMLEHIMVVSARPHSLDMTYNENTNPLSELVADESTGDQLQELSNSIDIQRVRDAIARLPMRNREMLEMRYGLNGNAPTTLEAIGKTYGLSRERVRQCCRNTMRQVERSLRADPQFRISQEWVAAA